MLPQCEQNLAFYIWIQKSKKYINFKRSLAILKSCIHYFVHQLASI